MTEKAREQATDDPFVGPSSLTLTLTFDPDVYETVFIARYLFEVPVEQIVSWAMREFHEKYSESTPFKTIRAVRKQHKLQLRAVQGEMMDKVPQQPKEASR
jgi:hypothetical protein